MSLIPQAPADDVDTAKENNVATPEHCFQAFDALYCELTESEPVEPRFPDEKYALFVTWNVQPSRPGRAPRLRGCIGTFEPLPIREGLAEYAIISAFKDSRFKRITEDELETLECAISLLTDFEDATSYLDWTIGVHGISISFQQPPATSSIWGSSSSEAPSPYSSSSSLLPARFTSISRRRFSACYLPEVAEEQGWDKIEALDSAIRKAGYSGRITEDLRRSVKLRRYQSSKCSVTFQDYLDWRDQVTKEEEEQAEVS